MGRVYAVASGKGGVGKTTTTAALGATLAATGASVAVVDADIGMANLGPSLGVDGDGPTLHDVLAGTATVADATREGPDGLAVVPGSRDIDAFADAHPEGLAEVLGTLADEYEYVLADTGAGLNTDSLAPLRAADEVVLVSTPTRDALADTERTAAVCGRFGTPVRGLVLVRADADDAERVRERVEWTVLGAVPDDPAVPEAVEAGVALPRHAPGSPAAAAYRDLARTLTGVAVPDPDEVSPGTGPAAPANSPVTDDGDAPDEGEGDAAPQEGGDEVAEEMDETGDEMLTEAAAAGDEGATTPGGDSEVAGEADDATPRDAEAGTVEDETAERAGEADVADVDEVDEVADDGDEDEGEESDDDEDEGEASDDDEDEGEASDEADEGDVGEDETADEDAGDDGGRKGFFARLFG